MFEPLYLDEPCETLAVLVGILAPAQDIDNVVAGYLMDADSGSLGNISYDGVAVYRMAALGKMYCDIFEPFYFDLVIDADLGRFGGFFWRQLMGIRIDRIDDVIVKLEEGSFGRFGNT